MFSTVLWLLTSLSTNLVWRCFSLLLNFEICSLIPDLKQFHEKPFAQKYMFWRFIFLKKLLNLKDKCQRLAFAELLVTVGKSIL